MKRQVSMNRFLIGIKGEESIENHQENVGDIEHFFEFKKMFRHELCVACSFLALHCAEGC